MDINVYKNVVYEFIDFLEDETHAELLNIVHSLTVAEQDYIQSEPIGLPFCEPWHFHMGDIIREQIISIWNKQLIGDQIEREQVNSLFQFLCYPPLHYKPLHADNVLDPTIVLGVVYYLNDNFDGGEIVYEDLDLKIKPKKNSLVIHGAHIPHKVQRVRGTNNRFVLTTFIYSGDAAFIHDTPSDSEDCLNECK